MKTPFLTAACLLLSACIPHPEYRTPTAALTYSFDAAQDMGDLFDFRAVYLDAEGRSVEERITALPWSRQVTAPTPFDAHLEVVFAVREEYPDRKTYEVGFEGDIVRTEAAAKSAGTGGGVADDRKLRFSVALPAGVSPAEVDLAVAPLKYDKHFAFTFTVDDASENGWSRIFRLIHGKWIDDEEFFHLGCTPTTGYVPEYTLAVTDGCGNERRFRFGEAICPTWRNFYGGQAHDPRMQESSLNSVYVTWEELRVMLDFGCSVHYHNVDETRYDKTDPEQILEGFRDDYDRTLEKLGRGMKVLALPDGNYEYLDAAARFPQIEFTRSSRTDELIYLNSCGSLRGKQTYGGEHTSDIATKMNELAAQATSENPYWVGWTVHRASLDHMKALDEIYRLYGAAGADNIWVASWDEIYEYQELRYGAVVEKSVEGQTLTFEVTLPERQNFYFHELSFLLTGAGGAAVTPLSENLYGLSTADRSGDLLVNVIFDPQLPVRAEKYTARYEATGSETDRDDARYLVSMLRPDLAAPLLARLDGTRPPLVLEEVTIDGGAATVYGRRVTVAITASGTPDAYRIGETEDLSTQAWQDFDGSPVDYTLSEGFGPKSVYVQLADGTRQSEVGCATVLYADVPRAGVIGREAVEAYREKYDGYTLVVDRKITAK